MAEPMYRLTFPSLDRPYFIANFAVTIDGRVARTASPYWPVASRLDFQVVEELRAQVDVLLHGKNTALEHRHAVSLGKDGFQELRRSFDCTKRYTYMALSGHPDPGLLEHLAAQGDVVRIILVTTEQAAIDDASYPTVEVWRLGPAEINLQELAAKMKQQGMGSCMVEGGPSVFGSFVAAELIDELFLTLAPKILGSGPQSLSLLESVQFPPALVKKLELGELQRRENEVYLRYKFLR